MIFVVGDAVFYAVLFCYNLNFNLTRYLKWTQQKT